MRRLRAAADGRVTGLRCLARTRGGEAVPVELSAALVRAGGRDEALLGLFRDLRERDRIEAELASAQARLAEAEKERVIAALGGAAAHELSQPLTVMLGKVEMLRRRIGDEQHRRDLDALAREADRMAQIVRRISSLTRIETVAYPGELEIAVLDKPRP